VPGVLWTKTCPIDENFSRLNGSANEDRVTVPSISLLYRTGDGFSVYVNNRSSPCLRACREGVKSEGAFALCHTGKVTA